MLLFQNEYPWQVALVRAGSKQPFCGGTILSTQTILTAAHCEPSSVATIMYKF